MIAGAAFVRFLLSSGGLSVVLLLLAVWAVARPRSRAARTTLIAVAVAYALISCYPVPHWIAGWLASPYQPLTRDRVPSGRTAIVLLGSGAYTQTDWQGGQFSVLDYNGAERTLEAARLYRLLGDPLVISSGGRAITDDPDTPSGHVMRDSLIQLGIPAARIVIEDQSQTTRDEATLIKALLPSLGVDHLVLVTSAVHMRRSEGVFRSVGLDVIPAIARDASHSGDGGWLTWIPSADGLDESEAVAHELLGLAYYRLRGWQ